MADFPHKNIGHCCIGRNALYYRKYRGTVDIPLHYQCQVRSVTGRPDFWLVCGAPRWDMAVIGPGTVAATTTSDLILRCFQPSSLYVYQDRSGQKIWEDGLVNRLSSERSIALSIGCYLPILRFFVFSTVCELFWLITRSLI